MRESDFISREKGSAEFCAHGDDSFTRKEERGAEMKSAVLSLRYIKKYRPYSKLAWIKRRILRRIRG